MGLEAILAAIHASGDARVAAVEAETRVLVERERERGRREAEAIQARARDEQLARAARTRARRLEDARLEALLIVEGEREALVTEVLDGARAAFKDFRASPDYAGTLLRLVEEALALLSESLPDSEAPSLLADSRDRAAVEAAVAALDCDAQIRYQLTCAGGVAAQTADGRIVVRNTLESRLERAQPYLRWRLGWAIQARDPARRAAPDPA